MFEMIDWLTQPVGTWGHVARIVCVFAAMGMLAAVVELTVIAHRVDRAPAKIPAARTKKPAPAPAPTTEVVEAQPLPLPRERFVYAEPVVTEDRFPELAQMLLIEAASHAAISGPPRRIEPWPAARRVNGHQAPALAAAAANEITSETE